MPNIDCHFVGVHLSLPRIMILINLVVLHRGSEVGRVLGAPAQMDLMKVVPNGHSTSGPVQPPPPFSSNPPPMAPKPFSTAATAGTGPSYGGGGGSMAGRPGGANMYGGAPTTTPTRSPMGGSSGARGNIYPIAGLNPYQNK